MSHDLRFLIADDDDDMRAWLKAVLAPLGAKIDEAVDGSDLLWALGSDVAYTGIIIDEQMPPPYGHLVAGMARATGLNVPILVISAWPSEDLKLSVAQLESTQFLPKPLKREDVVNWCVDSIRSLPGEAHTPESTPTPDETGGN